MKELLQQSAAKIEEVKNRLVCLFIAAKEYELSGNWQWELYCDAVYCSDVMVSLPTIFEGTKGIIHPDDAAYVRDRVSATTEEKIPFLQFRMITTYGEVKTLTGKEVTYSEIDASFSIEHEQEEQIVKEQIVSKQIQKLLFKKRATEIAQNFTAVGTWHFDVSTNEMHYSDAVFELFRLPQQSLNAHLHTFSPYIYEEDRDIVVDAFNKAFKEQLPLHLEYRINNSNGVLKMVRLGTQWEYTQQGSLVLYGFLQDITELKDFEVKINTLENDLELGHRQLQLMDQSSATGYWYINLVTRKIVYSDSIFRLHGIKPSSMPAAINIFLNYVHPDDRDVVKEVTRKIVHEHAPPDIEYRIVSNDGKVKYLRQRGKIVIYRKSELVMLVTLQDITAETSNERKLAELTEQLSVRQFANQQAEEMAGMGSWYWDMESDKITWSDSMYQLLGLKPIITPLTQKTLKRFVHPDDIKKFSDEISIFQHEKKVSKFHFRIIRSGEVRYISASFKPMNFEGKGLFFGMLQDVTQNHLLQQQLTERVQLAESLSENIQDAVLITDDNNNIIFWNRRCNETYGLEKEEVLHKNYFDVLPQFREEETIKQFQQVFKGQKITLQAVLSAGVTGYHHLFLLPIKNEEDIVTGILHIRQDVTAEQNMQQRLTERLNFIEGLVEASVDRIIVIDRHMNYLYCNQKAADFYGLNKEDIVGKNVLEVFPNAVNDPSYEHIRKAFKGEMVHLPAIDGISHEHYYQVFLIPIKDALDHVSAVLWMHHDLSGELKLQRQLKKADELLNSINQAYIELDHEGVFRYVNTKAEELLKKDKEQILDKNIWYVLPQYITSEPYNIITKALTEKVTAGGEYYWAQSGQWMYMSAMPTAEGAIVLFYDITERKNAALEIKEKAQLIQSINNATADILYVMMLDTKKITYTNRHIAAVLGYNKGDLPDFENSFFDLVFSTDRESMLQHLENLKMAPDGEVREIEYRMISADGAIKWYKDRNVVFERNNEGVPVSKIGVSEDITERKKREDELFKNLSILKQAEEVACMGSWDYSVHEDKMTWSEGMYQLFEVEQGTTVKKEIYKKLSIDDAVAKRFLKKLTEGLNPLEETIPIKTTSGIVKTIKVKAIAIKDKEGKPLRMLGVDLDITELVHTERKLKELNTSLDKRNNELIEKNEELAAFAFIASHDLKEPLRKINIFSNLISEREEENLTTSGKDYLQRMRQAVKRMELLIDDVLTLSRLHSNNESIEKIALKDVIDNAKAEFELQITETGATITLQGSPIINGIGTQLFYLFNNLIGNALKFQSKGATPQITISATEVKGSTIAFAGVRAEKYLKVAVKDNGIGFEQEQARKIFQIFQRLHGITEYPGTGIGLAICKKIMDNHQGFIEAVSEPGKGTVFYCYFPIVY